MHPRSLPIASASYVGAQDVPALDRPRMWSILDPPPAPKAPTQQPATVASQQNNVEPLLQPVSGHAIKEQALPVLKNAKPPNRTPAAAAVAQKSAKATADVKAFAAALSGAPSIPKAQIATQVPAAAAATAAALPRATDDESSDSEGSLPDIDSGVDEE